MVKLDRTVGAVQRPEVAKAIVEGFKKAGIDLVVIGTPEL